MHVCVSAQLYNVDFELRAYAPIPKRTPNAKALTQFSFLQSDRPYDAVMLVNRMCYSLYSSCSYNVHRCRTAYTLTIRQKLCCTVYIHKARTMHTSPTIDVDAFTVFLELSTISVVNTINRRMVQPHPVQINGVVQILGVRSGLWKRTVPYVKAPCKCCRCTAWLLYLFRWVAHVYPSLQNSTWHTQNMKQYSRDKGVNKVNECMYKS